MISFSKKRIFLFAFLLIAVSLCVLITIEYAWTNHTYRIISLPPEYLAETNSLLFSPQPLPDAIVEIDPLAGTTVCQGSRISITLKGDNITWGNPSLYINGEHIPNKYLYLTSWGSLGNDDSFVFMVTITNDVQLPSGKYLMRISWDNSFFSILHATSYAWAYEITNDCLATPTT